MGLAHKAIFFKNLVIAKSLHKNLPLTVILNITDRCNLKCAYCYALYHQRKEDEMTTDQICSIIDELQTMGCKRISLGGGEPLLRIDLDELIEHVKNRGMECVINSNGYLVKEKIGILRRIDNLCLSLDGDRQAHDIYRGIGSFDRVMEAIECATRYRIPLYTNTVLHRGNLDSVDFVLNLAEKYNFLAEFNLAIACLYSDDKNAEYKSSDTGIKDVLRRLIHYKRKRRNIAFSRKAFEYALEWPTYSQEAYFGQKPNFKHLSCYAGKYFCFIDTNGDVYPCPHLIGKTKPINAAKEGFQKAFVNLDSHNCMACYQMYHNEFNLLFSLDCNVICDHIKNSLRF